MKKIVLILATIFLFSGCSDDKKVEVIQKEKSVEKKVEPVIDKSLKKESSIEEKIQKKIETEGMKVIDSKLVVDAEVVTSEAANEDIIQPIENEDKIVDEKINKMVQMSEQQIVSSSVGKQLYLKCAGCHGKKAEKMALGKSKVVQGWSKDDIYNALIGYKDGTYGGVMKGVMKSQVASLNEIEVNTLSEYMAALK